MLGKKLSQKLPAWTEKVYLKSAYKPDLTIQIKRFLCPFPNPNRVRAALQVPLFGRESCSNENFNRKFSHDGVTLR